MGDLRSYLEKKNFPTKYLSSVTEAFVKDKLAYLLSQYQHGEPHPFDMRIPPDMRSSAVKLFKSGTLRHLKELPGSTTAVSSDKRSVSVIYCINLHMQSQKKSGHEKESRKPFYSNVQKFQSTFLGSSTFTSLDPNAGLKHREERNHDFPSRNRSYSRERFSSNFSFQYLERRYLQTLDKPSLGVPIKPKIASVIASIQMRCQSPISRSKFSHRTCVTQHWHVSSESSILSEV